MSLYSSRYLMGSKPGLSVVCNSYFVENASGRFANGQVGENVDISSAGHVDWGVGPAGIAPPSLPNTWTHGDLWPMATLLTPDCVHTWGTMLI